MDWTQVFVAALAGGLGAAVGSLVGAFFARMTGRFGTQLARITALVGAVLGYLLGTPFIERAVGPTVRGLVGPPAELRNLGEELRARPTFEVLLERRPGLEAEFTQLVRDAYTNGGDEGATRAAMAWGASVFPILAAEAAPHARDEDLINWLRETARMFDVLLVGDPLLCHDFLFGAQTNHMVAPESLTPELVEVAERVSDEAFAPLIANADYSFERPISGEDRAAFESVAAGFVAELGSERVRFVQTDRPENAEDARIVCRATAGLYESALAHPRAAQIARIMLAQ